MVAASSIYRHYPNDLRQARLTLAGLGMFDIALAALIVWMLLSRS